MKLETQISENAIRHRVLDGVLTRIARLPAADSFILRGGMLLRMWFQDFDRPSSDIDLVSTSAFDVQQAERQLLPLLRDDELDDGIAFDQRRYRVQGIWLDTDFPGIRMIAFASFDGKQYPFSIDVTFGESLVPEPSMGEFVFSSRPSVRLRMCRPEAIAARKLHAIWDMGLRHWRPKDLFDVYLLLRCVPMKRDNLSAAIDYSFSSRGDSAGDIRDLFDADSWWTTRTAEARWRDFVKSSNSPVLASLPEVVEDVGVKLNLMLK